MTEPAAASQAASTGDPKPQPTKFYQWVLLYPALALALGGSVAGSIPTVIREVKAWRLGVQSSQLDLVREQARLWERNVACLQEGSSYEIDGPQGIVVRVTLCTTGDALLRYHLNAWPPIYRWVALPVEKVSTQADTSSSP